MELLLYLRANCLATCAMFSGKQLSVPGLLLRKIIKILEYRIGIATMLNSYCVYRILQLSVFDVLIFFKKFLVPVLICSRLYQFFYVTCFDKI